MKKYIRPILISVLFLLIFIVFRTLFYEILKNSNIVIKFLPSTSNFIAAILALFILMKRNNTSLDYIDINSISCGSKNFFRGMLKGLIFSFSVAALLYITFEAAFAGVTKGNISIFLVAIFGIFNIFMDVCSEELIYRGYILHYLKQKYTYSGAIIISSLIFAFMHNFNIYSTPIAILNSFLAGLLLSILVLKYNSLEYAFGLHFSWNIVIYLIFSSYKSRSEFPGIYNLSYKNIELLNGGGYGIEGGFLFTLALLCLIFYLYKKSYFKRFLYISKKNLCLTLILFLSVIIFTCYDIICWHTQSLTFDNGHLKTISKLNNANDYTMNWHLDTVSKKVLSSQDVDYINTSRDNLNEIYFHIYAAAFKKYDGQITLKNIMVNGEPAAFNIEGSDKSLLRVCLKNGLGSDKRVRIHLDYTIDIPHRSNNGFADRFAYSNNAINLGNCFPIAAVYEDGKWDKHLYDEKGDAFFSETSNFKVKITAPKDYILAVTGVVDSCQADQGEKIWNITANSVRDFALVASNKFKVAEGNVGGTMIKSYAFNKFKAKKTLVISGNAIKSFNRRFGEYPYPTCSIVETDLNGGMEYPTMVMILSEDYDNISFGNIFSKLFYKSATGELEFTIVHELAHQWWYGLVGNDEYRDAWIDEPLTQFSTLLYYKDNYGKDYFESIYRSSIANFYNLYKASIKNIDFKKPLNKFKTDSEYTELIYYKVPVLIKDYYDKVGDAKFNNVLRQTFSKYEFKILKGTDYPIPLNVQ
jgi:membrane protease YdiL (CAAX protease family)